MFDFAPPSLVIWFTILLVFALCASSMRLFTCFWLAMYCFKYSCLFGWLCWHAALNMVLCSFLVAFADLISALDILVFLFSVIVLDPILFSRFFIIIFWRYW